MNPLFFIDPIIVGLWAFLFTNPLQQNGQVFWWVKKGLLNLDPLVRIGEKKAADEDRITGVSWVLWNWGTCHKCHAGFISILYGLSFVPIWVNEFYMYGLKDIFYFGVVAIGSSMLFKKNL